MKMLLYAAGLHQWRPSNPTCWWRDIPSPAGTELGIYGYCKAMADRGHHVTVVMPTNPPGLYDGVEYLNPPYDIPKGEFDAIVSVHYADPLRDRYAPLQACLALSHHMVGIETVDQYVDKYMTPSRWGRERLMASHPGIDSSKFWITRIGVWLDQFKQQKCVRDPHHLVWASSPDRGLWHMVDIMKKLPQDYRLTVAYDFDDFLARSDHIPTLLILRKALPLKDMDNVEFVGHLSQPQLARLFQEAGMLVYPGDVPETYAVTMNQAAAAGLPILASAIGSFPENYGGDWVSAALMPHPVNPDDWVRTIQLLTESPHNEYGQLQANALDQAALTDFSSVAEDWEEFFTNFLNHNEDRTQLDKSLASHRERVHE